MALDPKEDDMKKADTKFSDKYFHAKANCQAAQQGKAGAATAKKISDTREKIDIPKNKYIKKYSTEEIITDYRDDQCANYYGRIQGAAHPDIDCKILVDKYRPKGLNKKY